MSDAPQSRVMMRLRFASEEEARQLSEVIAPENEGYVATRVDGSDLVLEAAADAPLSLLRTLDDALACLAAAERARRAVDAPTG